MDTSTHKVVYPACRTYAWERIGINPQYMKFWHSIATNAKGASKNPRAHITWHDVIQELYRLTEDENRDSLTPAEFKAVLIAKAGERGWYRQTSARTGFTAKVEGRSDLRRCSKCIKEKPVDDFKAEATPKRKVKYNWGKDGNPTADRRLYTHHLCSACRADKKRKPKAQRGLVRCAHLRTQMDVVFKLSRNFIASVEDKRDESDLDWVCSDQRYYFHKIRLDAIRQVRAMLDTLEISDEPVPEKWQMLLSPEVRQRLFKRFEEDVLPAWSGRGKQPKCF